MSNWDWDIVPENKQEWVVLLISLLIILATAWWISR